MKKKDTRKYFFSSMGITLCICILGGAFLTADYNNRKLSGQSIVADSSLVEKLNESDESGKTEKITDMLLEKVIFPFEELVAGVSEKIMDFCFSDTA